MLEIKRVQFFDSQCMYVCMYMHVCMYVCVCVRKFYYQPAVCIMNTTDELATLILKGDVAFLQTSDLGLLRHDSCRNKVWAGVRVNQKVSPCVWDECDFHVNWLHISRIRPTHWRLNYDFDNQRRRHLTRNIRIGVSVCIRSGWLISCSLFNSRRIVIALLTGLTGGRRSTGAYNYLLADLQWGGGAGAGGGGGEWWVCSSL